VHLVDDQTLILQCRAGDQAAFRELVKRYQQKAYGIAFSMLRDSDDAMDVTQEAFIKVHRYLDNFKGSSSFYTWLYRITVNLCIDHIRKNKKAQTVDYDDAMDHDEAQGGELLPSTLEMDPARNLDRRELREMIDRALETLSPTHRAVILMREVEGLSYREMSEVMEVSMGTIMSRLFHARRRMQAALLEDMDSEEGKDKGDVADEPRAAAK